MAKWLLSVCEPMVRRFETGENGYFFFFGNLDSNNSRLDREAVVIPWKNIGFWLAFTLLGSQRDSLMIIGRMHANLSHFSVNFYEWNGSTFSLEKLHFNCEVSTFLRENMCKMNINETKPRQNQSSHNFWKH